MWIWENFRAYRRHVPVRGLHGGHPQGDAVAPARFQQAGHALPGIRSHVSAGHLGVMHCSSASIPECIRGSCTSEWLSIITGAEPKLVRAHHRSPAPCVRDGETSPSRWLPRCESWTARAWFDLVWLIRHCYPSEGALGQNVKAGVL